jgi:hypothetical protein
MMMVLMIENVTHVLTDVLPVLTELLIVIPVKLTELNQKEVVSVKTDGMKTETFVKNVTDPDV